MRKPFTVEIEESYHKTVVIYAEDDLEAEEIAHQLCDNGEIDMERNCYAGRACNSSGESSKEDMKNFFVYHIDEDGQLSGVDC